MKKYFAQLLIFSISFFCCTQANAINLAIDEVLLDCIPTPGFVSETYPGEENISRINNLRRKTGIALVAQGEPIYVIGKVVDEDCIPVEDAKVEMWHANAYGVYQKALESGEKKDENFLSAGFVLTDNLGHFNFLSIFPGAANETTAPRLHFKIKHKDFEPFETVMYFPEEATNLSDTTLESLGENSDYIIASHKLTIQDGSKGLEIPEQDTVYNFNITLKGKYTQKHY